MTAQAMRAARDDWWIIGSGAVALHGVALHGAAPVTIADVDVLLSEEDARRLMADLHIAPSPLADHPHFRSAIFTRWTAPPLAVEFMAGFHVATPDGWAPVRPRSRIPVAIESGIVHIPERDDLADILRLFGRPKDVARARLLLR